MGYLPYQPVLDFFRIPSTVCADYFNLFHIFTWIIYTYVYIYTYPALEFHVDPTYILQYRCCGRSHSFEKRQFWVSNPTVQLPMCTTLPTRCVSFLQFPLPFSSKSAPSHPILSHPANLVAYDDMDGHQWAARPLLEDAGDSIFLSEFQVKTVQRFWVNKSLFTDRIETDFCQVSWFQLKRPSRISIVINTVL